MKSNVFKVIRGSFFVISGFIATFAGVYVHQEKNDGLAFGGIGFSLLGGWQIKSAKNSLEKPIWHN